MDDEDSREALTPTARYLANGCEQAAALCHRLGVGPLGRDNLVGEANESTTHAESVERRATRSVGHRTSTTGM